MYKTRVKAKTDDDRILWRRRENEWLVNLCIKTNIWIRFFVFLVFWFYAYTDDKLQDILLEKVQIKNFFFLHLHDFFFWFFWLIEFKRRI